LKSLEKESKHASDFFPEQITAETVEKSKPAQSKPMKPSITAGLQDAIAEAREYNAVRTSQTPQKSNKKEIE
jgi:hypothetical protein